tara:strand:+ start:220 stop:1218 length:999 start_codon:yes stop_codon:yes gene_type:complete
MSVSIIIPTLNEENYIADCLESLLASLTDCKEYEIIIVDGESNDNTINIVNQFRKNNQRIKIINNPKKIAPSALNLGVEASKYDIIIRCDAHAYYPSEYIQNNIDLLISSDEKTMNVGGYIYSKSKDKNLISSSIAKVLSSSFGVGNSNFRTGATKNKKIIEADTVPFGCFKKSIFKLIGNFNEDEPANEDIEFNHRIRKHGYKILLSNSITSYYYVRSNLIDFIKQTLRNGLITTINKNFSFRSIRHYTPLFFFLFLIFGLISILIFNNKIILFLYYLGISMYLIFILVGTVFILIKHKELKFLFIGPFLFFVLHFFYGLGSFIGLITKKV